MTIPFWLRLGWKGPGHAPFFHQLVLKCVYVDKSLIACVISFDIISRNKYRYLPISLTFHRLSFFAPVLSSSAHRKSVARFCLSIFLYADDFHSIVSQIKLVRTKPFSEQFIGLVGKVQSHQRLLIMNDAMDYDFEIENSVLSAVLVIRDLDVQTIVQLGFVQFRLFHLV